MSSSVGTNLLSIYIVHDGMRERIPAGASDESDEIIWNDLICKYICKDNKDNFCKTEFLQAIINGKIQMPGAFELSEIKKALDDDNHHYSVSINRRLRLDDHK